MFITVVCVSVYPFSYRYAALACASARPSACGGGHRPLWARRVPQQIAREISCGPELCRVDARAAELSGTRMRV